MRKKFKSTKIKVKKIKNKIHQQQNPHIHLYMFRQVSDLDLHRIRQVTDGEVPHAARHHVAVQRAAVLLFLKHNINII